MVSEPRKAFDLRLLPKRLSRPAVLRHHRDRGVMVAPLLFLSLLTGAILVFRPVAALILGPSAPAVIDASLKAPNPVLRQWRRGMAGASS